MKDTNGIEQCIEDFCKEEGVSISITLEDGATKENVEETLKVVKEILKKHK